MFSFKKRQLDEVIQKARENERIETEKKLNRDYERKELKMIGEHKLEIERLKSDILKLKKVIDDNHSHVIEADRNKTESTKELRQAKIMMTILSEVSKNFLSQQGKLLQPFLKLNHDITINKEDIEIKNIEELQK